MILRNHSNMLIWWKHFLLLLVSVETIIKNFSGLFYIQQFSIYLKQKSFVTL